MVGDAVMPGGDTPAAVVETHISTIFLTADRAYKLLKPIRMPFLDHTDPARRMAAISRELELNRRLSPDVYLGTADVEENGVVVDSMVVMRRLPDARRLSTLASAGAATACLREVARTVAAFHSRQDPVDPAPMATRDAVRVNWEDNFAVIGRHAGTIVEVAEFEQAATLARRYLDHREALFDARIRAGAVRDGHGDLIADDIFCLDDGPRIIDCLAFSDDWRIGDVLLDIGFLVMDIHRLSGPEAAGAVLRAYQEFGNEHHPDSLAHHYIAYRAHVRAKVACLRHEQGDEASATLAREYHRLALHHLERARLRLVLVGGGPGAGKSTLAAALGSHFGYPVLATDEIRKAVTGTARDEHRFAAPGGGIYDDAGIDAVYAEQRREAGLLLDAGSGAVLDASWSHERHRAAARSLAAGHGAELIEIECVVDPDVARERIGRRLAQSDNVSDATPDLVDHMRSHWDAWDAALTIPTGASAEVVRAATIARLAEGDPQLP